MRAPPTTPREEGRPPVLLIFSFIPIYVTITGRRKKSLFSLNPAEQQAILTPSPAYPPFNIGNVIETYHLKGRTSKLM